MFNEVEKMIDQEQVARTLINLIDVVHQENWVLLNTKDMDNKQKSILFVSLVNMEKQKQQMKLRKRLRKIKIFLIGLLLEMNSTQKRCVILWSLIAF